MHYKSYQKVCHQFIVYELQAHTYDNVKGTTYHNIDRKSSLMNIRDGTVRQSSLPVTANQCLTCSEITLIFISNY